MGQGLSLQQVLVLHINDFKVSLKFAAQLPTFRTTGYLTHLNSPALRFLNHWGILFALWPLFRFCVLLEDFSPSCYPESRFWLSLMCTWQWLGVPRSDFSWFSCSGPYFQWVPALHAVKTWSTCRGISFSSPALCANFSGIHHYVYLGEGVMSLEEDLSSFLQPSCLAPAFSTLPPLLHSVKTLGKVIASCYRFTLARGLQDSNPSLKLIPRHWFLYISICNGFLFLPIPHCQ